MSGFTLRGKQRPPVYVDGDIVDDGQRQMWSTPLMCKQEHTKNTHTHTHQPRKAFK